MTLSRLFRFLLLVTVLFLGATYSRAEDLAAAPAKKIRIVLVGDSTVTDHAGWGLGFKQFIDPERIELINTAMGGRSSMSFIKEHRWEKALALHGDYYLVQFGHNNEPGKPGRSTDMPTYVADMNRYVDEARAIGAKPVLVTPLSRRQWDSAHAGKIASTLVPYAEEVRKIATAKNVPLVELHDRSRALYEQIGPEACLEFSPTKVVDGKTVPDGTHLNGKGSVMFARIVVEELVRAEPELAPCFRKEPLDSNPPQHPPAKDEPSDSVSAPAKTGAVDTK